MLQLGRGPLGEEGHAPHRAVARNREIGEEDVELGRRSRYELGRERRHAAVDRPVDRIAVDVADAPESHSTPSSTGSARGRAAAARRCSIRKVGPSGPSGRARAGPVGAPGPAAPATQSSNVRTVRYSESRSAGSLPAPRIKPTIWS